MCSINELPSVMLYIKAIYASINILYEYIKYIKQVLSTLMQFEIAICLYTLSGLVNQNRADTYIKPFVTETCKLSDTGLTYFSQKYKQEQRIYVGVTLCISDGPARSRLLLEVDEK